MALTHKDPVGGVIVVVSMSETGKLQAMATLWSFLARRAEDLELDGMQNEASQR